MNILQIGANKGYDDLTELIKDKEVDLFVAVEPFSEHNHSLTECYNHLENFFIENIIISDNEKPCTKGIYYHEDDANHSNSFELASLNKQHSLKIRNNYTIDKVKKRELECLSVNRLLKKYNISHLDILYVDTEGHDDKIIKSIDFDNITISAIYYENLHIDVSDLRSFLENKNYIIERHVMTGGWSDLATLKSDI